MKLSSDRRRVREALRSHEALGLHSLTREDLAKVSGVDSCKLADLVRTDLRHGFARLPSIIQAMNQDGMDERALMEEAIQRCPYPMWINLQGPFGGAVYVHATYIRTFKWLALWDKKNRAERVNKLEFIDTLALSSPIIAKALRGEPTVHALKERF